jgi:hypothetical protein
MRGAPRGDEPGGGVSPPLVVGTAHRSREADPCGPAFGRTLRCRRAGSRGGRSDTATCVLGRPCCCGVCPIARLSDGGCGAHLVLDLGLGVTPWLRGGNHAARAFLAAAVVGVAIVSTRVVNEGNGAASGRPDIDVLSAEELLRAARQPCVRPAGRLFSTGEILASRHRLATRSPSGEAAGAQIERAGFRRNQLRRGGCSSSTGAAFVDSAACVPPYSCCSSNSGSEPG